MRRGEVCRGVESASKLVRSPCRPVEFRKYLGAVKHHDFHSADEASSPSSAIEALTFNRLFDQFGPLLPVEDAWKLLHFPTRDSFNRAILKGRLPLRLIRPPGRRVGFLATVAVAAYLATLATDAAEEDSTM